MEENFTPNTETELEQWMKKNCFNFNSYSIKGNSIYEGHGIYRSGGLYIWYYTERGQKVNLNYFETENEIVAFAYNQIKTDTWAKTHCIGFTTNKEESDELIDELKQMQIEFMQDKIPYYGLQRLVFRTFVFGCDINKTIHLKEKYYQENH